MFDACGTSADEGPLTRALAMVKCLLSVDPATATGPELSAALEAGGELRSIIDGAMVGLIPRWEASKDWAADGSRSPGTWIVNHTGATRYSAGALRRTGLLAAPMPHVSAAAAAGELPLTHLHQLTRARQPEVEERFDHDEATLVAHAKTLTADALAT